MAGPEFFQTQMGHRFYESTMPRIAKALEQLADCQAGKKLVEDFKSSIGRVRLLGGAFSEKRRTQLNDLLDILEKKVQE